MKDFKKLTIWNDGMQIVREVYKLADSLPEFERYGLRTQICRAAVSIPSNIAEGCSRSSEVDFKRFLEISLGSAFELETQILLIQSMKISKGFDFTFLLDLLNKEQKSLNSLINKIKSSKALI